MVEALKGMYDSAVPPSDTHRTRMRELRFDPGLHMLLFRLVRELQLQLRV